MYKTLPVRSRRPIQFMGSSLDDLRRFPPDARRAAGFELDQIQRGWLPIDWKPLKAVGEGVAEIRVRDSSGAFRVIYLSLRPEAVYVLHCFQKKTEKTSLRDINLARKRLQAIEFSS